MSRQANKTIIGGFVLGAVILSIVAVMFFGKGDFLSEKRTFVLFFDESIKGLEVGSPVMFKGVKIGSVTDIVVKIDNQDLSISIPVYIEIEQNRFTEFGKESLFKKVGVDGKAHVTEEFIKRGLRAQLQLQSLVTGKLFIALDFHPDKPMKLVGEDPRYTEIPTIPTSFQEIADTATRIIEEIRNLPVEELLESAIRLFDSVNKVISSSEIDKSLKSLQQTLDATRKLMRDVDKQVDPIVENVSKTLDAASAALEQAELTLLTAQEVVSERSPLRQETMGMFESLSNAARSIQILADYLQRHPEALLQGKTVPGGK